MSEIESLLLRIAVALEKIAGESQVGKTAGMPFPWGDTRVSRRFSSSSHRWPSTPSGERPGTFEELISIGRRRLQFGGSPAYVGPKIVQNLDPIFSENGYGPQWLNS